MSSLLHSLDKDTQSLENAYQLISEKKGKDWVPPWAKKEDEKNKKCKCKSADKGCDCDDCAECKTNQKKKEKGGNELTAKQKKLPPALQAAMSKKKKLKESFDEAYDKVIAYFDR